MADCPGTNWCAGFSRSESKGSDPDTLIDPGPHLGVVTDCRFEPPIPALAL
jgi:hypothetical protein